MGTLWSYADYQELQKFEISHLNEERSDTMLPCTLPSVKFICPPAEVNTHRKINLNLTPQSLKTQQALNELYEEYKDIFLLHQGDIDQTKLLMMDVDTWDNAPIAQKSYALPLKHTQWVYGKLGNIEKAGIISQSISLLSSSIVIVPQKAKLGEIPQKHLCIDYITVNTFYHQL